MSKKEKEKEKETRLNRQGLTHCTPTKSPMFLNFGYLPLSNPYRQPNLSYKGGGQRCA